MPITSISRFVFNHRNYLDISLAALVVLLVGCIVLITIIPPFQSPDEYDHIKRAYLLTNGVVVLDQPDGQNSGGYVDDGLLDYIHRYAVAKGRLSPEEITKANAIKWSGSTSYTPAPGTGYYFPAAYLPQAMGLWLGEQLQLTNAHSYFLARAFALATVILLIFIAFKLYPPNPLVLALLALPMSLFQFSSASLDGVSTALAIFAVSAFLRIASDGPRASQWLLYTLTIVIAILASSRAHALPLLLLIAGTFLYKRSSRSLFLFGVAVVLVVSWTTFALTTTVDLRVTLGKSSADVITYYLFNPTQLVSVLWHTLLSSDIQGFYLRSFIGILGWLDAPFAPGYYLYFSSGLLLVTLLTVAIKRNGHDWSQKLILASISGVSVLFIFFALLVTWTPHPATIISGVQGRYFLIPAIMLAYCVSGKASLNGNWRLGLATVVVFVLFVSSLSASVSLLIDRYYFVERSTEPQSRLNWPGGSFERQIRSADSG